MEEWRTAVQLEQLRWLYLGLSGRINRMAYFLAALFMSVLLAFFLYRSTLAGEVESGGGIWSVLFTLLALISLWSQIALSVKRLHDMGRPGIFALLLLVPFVNAAALVVLCLLPGERGPNAYGKTTNAPA